MSESTGVRTGRCQCGAVQFETTGRPRWVAHCHCGSCRRATASAFATYVGFARSQVQYVRGEPAGYHSSPGVTRRFCRECGTPLSYEGDRWPDEVHLFACVFEDPAAFQPQAHVHTNEQVAWLHLADDLPRHRTTSG